MKTRNTLPLIALVSAFALPGAVMFLAETPSQVSAQSQAMPAAHSQAAAASNAVAGTASIAAAAHPRPSFAGLTRIEILPSSISIVGPRYKQRLLVEGTFADGHQEELTQQSTLTISNPRVAIIDKDNFTLPQGDGQATITATLLGHRAIATVTVKDFAVATVWSFRNDVLPVMTKMGCNSGPCHGAAAGKNGFKLTLRGYDPEVDYLTLTHQALARRTEMMEPARSLILLKPTLTIPHGGGRRFPVDSPEFKVLAGWIAQAMPAPLDSDARVTKIEVLPGEASLRPGAQQQLL